MRLLLDTHTLLWWVWNSARLGKNARSLIGSDKTLIWVSAVSIWEMSIKAPLGRLERLPPFENELRLELERSDFRFLPITFEHAWAVSQLPLHHRDPFDRMLIAQARCEDLTLLTADHVIAAYHVRTIDAAR
jgi:PIN domain nuclease of toxin-antitoxin system